MLKQYLSLLLSKFYSKKENEAVGHQAMPSGNKIDIAAHPAEIDGWTNFATYTTPTDGYVSIRAEAYKSTAAIQISTGSEDKMPSIFTAANNAGEWLQTVIPVSKGVSVRLQGGGIKNVGSYFSKTIGGGYQALKNAFLQGGVLCLLSHWYSSLRKNSCKVRKSGLQTNQQFLFKILLNYLLLQMEKVTHLRCRTRGLLTSEDTEFGLPILEGSTLLTLGRLRMGTYRSGLTPKKVKNSPTQSGNQTSSLLPIFVYTKSKGTIDLMFGGASC